MSASSAARGSAAFLLTCRATELRTQGGQSALPGGRRDAAVLHQLREVLAGRQKRVADLQQPRFAWH